MMPHALAMAAPPIRQQDMPLDPDALFRENNAMVRRIAWQVRSGTSTMIEVADLIQIGLIALIEASRAFVDRGLPFAPYAAIRVRGAMIDALRKQSSDSRKAAAARRRLRDVRSGLEREHCRDIEDSEMADAMGLEPTRYHAFVAASVGPVHQSIDDAYSDYDLAFADRIEPADSFLENEEIKRRLEACIGALPPREAMVLQLYFVEELNLNEIGLILDVGSARVCQIKRAALQRLRSELAD